jgi:hypothetical protein
VFPGRPSDPRPARHAPRRSACWVPAALALALLGACGEPPSFQVSWRFTEPTLPGIEPPSPPELTEITQCTGIGVGGVRVTALPKGALPCDQAQAVAVSEYPCLPSSGLPVEGPTLEPGEYTVVVHGLRRSGEPWACPADVLDIERDLEGETVYDGEGNPIPICLEPSDPCVARDVVEITVDEQGKITAATRVGENGEDVLDGDTISLVLAAPQECDDGIDNDRDGQVDGADPACYEGALGAREFADFGVAYFDLRFLFLDTPVVELNNVEVDYLSLEIDGEPFAELHEFELELELGSYRAPLLAAIDADLHPDEEPPDQLHTHLFEVTAFGGGVERTATFEVEFSMAADEAGYVSELFEFTDDRFLEPLVYPARFTKSLVVGEAYKACELGGYFDGSLIEVERVRARVRDRDGVALTAAELGLMLGVVPLASMDEAEGWVSFDCPSPTLQTADLLWGGYTIELDAQIAGVSCFATEAPAPLAPEPGGDAQNFYLERILVDGAPPDACVECTEDGTKKCSSAVCVNGVCVPKEPEIP